MYHAAGQNPPRSAATRPAVPAPRQPAGGRAAPYLAALLALAFAAWTLLWQGRHLVRFDLRIVDRLVPVHYHPRLLQAVHPLVHLGDTAFVLPASTLVCLALYLRGYRRGWAIPLCALLTWVVELGCKSLLPQPGTGLSSGETSLRSMVHGPLAPALGQWLQHAAPYPMGAIIRHAGNATVNLTSSYPSGTTARGVFVLGLLAWAALRWGVPVLSELLALALLAPAAALGFVVVLYAWHWPSDVIGGYLSGVALLAAAIALLRYPVRPRGPVARLESWDETGPSPHSPHSRLPWVPHQ